MRAKELSDLKRRLSPSTLSDPFSIASKAIIVLSYSQWEGFYNDCIISYIYFLKTTQKSVVEVGWPMLVGSLSPQFDSLRDRNYSHEAKCDFVEAMALAENMNFEDYDIKIVSTRSNLDFEKLKASYRVLGFDFSSFNSVRIRLDKELVGWRHSVAHGDSPDLSNLNVESHIEFTNNLMLMVADQFQEAMLQHI